MLTNRQRYAMWVGATAWIPDGRIPGMLLASFRIRALTNAAMRQYDRHRRAKKRDR